MKEFKLIVAGGRDFNDYRKLEIEILALALGIYKDVDVSIVSGMARGADMLGYKFAKQHDVKVYEFPAHWDTYGKRAGFMRNETMANFADGLLAFYNGSRGTGHMIQLMKGLNKPVTVIPY